MERLMSLTSIALAIALFSVGVAEAQNDEPGIGSPPRRKLVVPETFQEMVRLSKTLRDELNALGEVDAPNGKPWAIEATAGTGGAINFKAGTISVGRDSPLELAYAVHTLYGSSESPIPLPVPGASTENGHVVLGRLAFPGVGSPLRWFDYASSHGPLSFSSLRDLKFQTHDMGHGPSGLALDAHFKAIRTAENLPYAFDVMADTFQGQQGRARRALTNLFFSDYHEDHPDEEAWQKLAAEAAEQAGMDRKLGPELLKAYRAAHRVAETSVLIPASAAPEDGGPLQDVEGVVRMVAPDLERRTEAAGQKVRDGVAVDGEE
jgi:hypothetical protein